jgi:uncharacterized protein
MRELLIYRNILKDKIVKKIIESENNKNSIFEATAFLVKVAAKRGYNGNIVKRYIYDLMKKDENSFTRSADIKIVNKNIENIVIKDIQSIKQFILKVSELFEKSGIDILFNEPEEIKEQCNFFKIMEEKDIYKIVVDLINYHSKNGTGNFINSSSFKWKDGKFKVVKNADVITFDEIVGYEYQKSVVIQNTEALAIGKKANNILLTGARGTGKSSSVKAAVHRFASLGVKIIEITREQIADLGIIMEKLAKSGRKYIIFIDDISFESFETGYKQIKSIIDGGLEKKPENIVLYATSNRRHIVKESFSEREGQDEVRMSDAVNEKLSLSDRFGITLHFMAPTQTEYLDMVYVIAENAGITMDRESIKREAIKWEITQNGKSGRTAKQFVDYLLSIE